MQTICVYNNDILLALL